MEQTAFEAKIATKLAKLKKKKKALAHKPVG